MLVACGLCALAGVLSAVALATPGHRSSPRHRGARGAVKACRHARHHRCATHRKHKHNARSKSSGRTGVSAPNGSGSGGSGSMGGTGGTGGSTSPGTAGAAPGAPGSKPGAGITTGSGGSGGSGGASGSGPGGAPEPSYVQVTAEDTEGFRFVLSRTSVPAGKVIIEFVNHGQDEHNLHAVEPSAGSEAGSLPNTAPGAHPQPTLDLRPGSYTLFCSLPEHEAKGMKATLVVQ